MPSLKTPSQLVAVLRVSWIHTQLHLIIPYHFLSRSLPHWIGISDILSCVRNSYLTHVILPKLSWEDFHWLYLNSPTWWAYLKQKVNGEQEKESIPCVKVGWKNLFLTITVCHHSASLMTPNGDPWEGFFYHNLSLMIDSYILWPTGSLMPKHL